MTPRQPENCTRIRVGPTQDARTLSLDDFDERLLGAFGRKNLARDLTHSLDALCVGQCVPVVGRKV